MLAQEGLENDASLERIEDLQNIKHTINIPLEYKTNTSVL